MKLLEITESKITKDKNSKNVPHLEITELVLVHCNLVTFLCIIVREGSQIANFRKKPSSSYTFVSNKPFDSLLEISPTNYRYF